MSINYSVLQNHEPGCSREEYIHLTRKSIDRKRKKGKFAQVIKGEKKLEEYSQEPEHIPVSEKRKIDLAIREKMKKEKAKKQKIRENKRKEREEKKRKEYEEFNNKIKMERERKRQEEEERERIHQEEEERERRYQEEEERERERKRQEEYYYNQQKKIDEEMNKQFLSYNKFDNDIFQQYDGENKYLLIDCINKLELLPNEDKENFNKFIKHNDKKCKRKLMKKYHSDKTINNSDDYKELASYMCKLINLVENNNRGEMEFDK
jgi:hypothetical protein